MQPDPDAEFAQRIDQIEQACTHRLSTDEIDLVALVDTIGAGVLRHHENFAHALLDQGLCLAHDGADGP